MPVPVPLFNMTLQNQTRLPLTQNTVMTPNVELQLYGGPQESVGIQLWGRGPKNRVTMRIVSTSSTPSMIRIEFFLHVRYHAAEFPAST